MEENRKEAFKKINKTMQNIRTTIALALVFSLLSLGVMSLKGTVSETYNNIVETISGS